MDVVLTYVAGGLRGIPARDLTAGDLARLVYTRQLAATGQRPRPASQAAVQALAAQLAATGVYQQPLPAPATPAKPNKPNKPTKKGGPG